MSLPPFPYGPPRGMPGMPGRMPAPNMPGMPGMHPGMPGMPPGMPGMPPMMPGAPHMPFPSQPGSQMYPIGMPPGPGGYAFAPRPGPPRPITRQPQPRAPPVVLPPPVVTAAPVPKETSIYVGKIASTVNDDFMQQLLEACGPVKSWKRMEDPETKQPKGFGFCAYEDAEGVLRAVRLLNNLKVDGQELLVKPNTATQKYIEHYEFQKNKEREKEAVKAALEKEAGEVTDVQPTGDAADNRVLERVMSLLTDREERAPKQTDAQRASDFLASLTDGQKLPPPPARPDHLDRKAFKPEEDEKERERQLEKELKRSRDREKVEEEARRKEADKMYEMKLKAWERYERDAAHLREKERQKLKEAEKERPRLIRAELEASDTDDEVEPWRRPPLRSSRRGDERRKRMHREMEEDAIDRRREAEEVAAKRARLEAEGIKEEDVEMEEAREAEEASLGQGASPAMQQSSEVKEEDKEPEIDPNDPIYQAMIAAATAPPVRPPPPVKVEPKPEPSPERHYKPESPAPAPLPAPRLGTKKPNPNLMALFGEDDEEESRRKKLVPLQYTEEEMRAVHEGPSVPEDPALQLRRMADSIPTNKDGVFTYKVKWDAYEPSTMGSRVSRWVSKKVKELLGNEEEMLTEFVLKMLADHTPQGKMYDEMAQVLEPAEAEKFVIMLFRMVIYDTEKAALGL